MLSFAKFSAYVAKFKGLRIDGLYIVDDELPELLRVLLCVHVKSDLHMRVMRALIKSAHRDDTLWKDVKETVGYLRSLDEKTGRK